MGTLATFGNVNLGMCDRSGDARSGMASGGLEAGVRACPKWQGIDEDPAERSYYALFSAQ
jgi:hypothetical protein